MKQLMRTGGLFLGLMGIALLSGCMTSRPEVQSDSETPENISELSLYEQRLIRLIKAKDEFDQWVQVEGQANPLEVQRRFHGLSGSFQTLVADNPNQVEARLIYGKFLDFYGDTQGAFEQFVKVLELDASLGVVHQQLGTLYAEKGDFPRALSYYLRATELEPNEAAYHYGLGELLFAFRPGFVDQKIFDGATIDRSTYEAFKQAAALAPDNILYQFRLGEAYYEFDDPDWKGAFDYWEQLKAREDLNDFQRDSIRLEQARCLGELGQFEAALNLAEKEVIEPLVENQEALVEGLKAAIMKDIP